MRKYLLLLPLLVTACQGEAPQNVAEIANISTTPANEAAPAENPASNAADPLQPASLTVGALRVPYNQARLSPVRANLPLPPDWKQSVEGVKLIASDRVELIGKAECLYGQSGEATQCNPEQEAGLAFAALPAPFAGAAARLPADQRRSISLAGAEGVSWEIGAEGEGAEYILLPAGEGTILIVRQFRTSGNPDEQALATVLSDMRLRQ